MRAFQVAVGLLCCFVAVTHAGWTTESPLESADSSGVTFVGSTVALTRILIDENLPPGTVIAKLNFDDEGGTLAPPEITGFDDGKNNSALGAKTMKLGVAWFLLVEFPQDYERPEQQQYGFYLDTGAPGLGHRVLLITRNLNDNSPTIDARESECVIDENTEVTVNTTKCTFLVRDRDGDIGHVTFRVYGSLYFSIEFLEIIDSYSAFAGMLVASPGLDFEETSFYDLVIQAKDDGFTSVTGYTIQVADLPDKLNLGLRAVRAP